MDSKRKPIYDDIVRNILPKPGQKHGLTLGSKSLRDAFVRKNYNIHSPAKSIHKFSTPPSCVHQISSKMLNLPLMHYKM